MKYLLIGLMVLACNCGGKTGPQGPVGQTGPTGATGSQGIPGTNGTNGTNAQGDTPIQLCQSCPSVYPTTFPESALCIDDILYGVYSANGGFLSELTPGEYSSDGINCSCNFTVGNDCQVTDN